MKKFKRILFITIYSALFLFPLFSAQESGGRRVALVIGNENYKNSPLNNPVRDAKAFKKKLEELNFDVDEAYDVNREKMNSALKSFYKKSENADLALFYYSGHGIECNGKNYILPVGQDFEDDEESFDENAKNLAQIIERIENTGCSKYIMILDACRNNPLKTTRGSSNRGITTVPTSSSAEGLIFYSCASGATADDGEGKHSPFTQALIDHIADPGASFNQVIGSVTKAVKEATKNKQVPYTTGSQTTETYLNGKPEINPANYDNNIHSDNSNLIRFSLILFVLFLFIMIICFIAFTERGHKIIVAAKKTSVNLKNQTSEFTIRTVSNLKEKAKASQEKKKEEKASQEISSYLDSVLVDKKFYCTLSPVTVLQYREISGQTDFEPEAKDNEPVTNISYLDAVQFMNDLSNKDKLECVYDLSNPQNIKIDRSKNGWRLPDEAEWKRAANTKQVSDMTGLVWQWCNDSKKGKYMLKGGSWDSPESLINTNSRMMVVKDFKSDALGMIGVRNK